MNIIDAIKSGKPYRRKAWHTAKEGRWRDPVNFQKDWNGSYSESIGDLIADDWEIQEPTVTITQTQFLKACTSVRKNGDSYWSWSSNVAFKLLATKLGLGDE